MNETLELHALQRAHHAGTTGRFRVSSHGWRRMQERGAQREGVRAALRSAVRAAKLQDEKWGLEGGTGLDGEGLTVIAAIDGRVVVVKVF